MSNQTETLAQRIARILAEQKQQTKEALERVLIQKGIKK